jgi:hypothetical protein
MFFFTFIFFISLAVNVEDDASKQIDLWEQQCTDDNIPGK